MAKPTSTEKIDVFPHVLTRKYKEVLFKKAKTSFYLKADKILTPKDTFPLPTPFRIPVASQASNPTTLAFTSPRSHRVFIIGCPGSHTW